MNNAQRKRKARDEKLIAKGCRPRSSVAQRNLARNNNVRVPSKTEMAGRGEAVFSLLGMTLPMHAGSRLIVPRGR